MPPPRKRKTVEKPSKALQRRVARTKLSRGEIKKLQKVVGKARKTKQDTRRKRRQKRIDREIDKHFEFDTAEDKADFRKRVSLHRVTTRAQVEADKTEFFVDSARGFAVRKGPRGGISRKPKDRIPLGKFRRSQSLRAYWRRVHSNADVSGISVKEARKIETFNLDRRRALAEFRKKFPNLSNKDFRASMTQQENDLWDEVVNEFGGYKFL